MIVRTLSSLLLAVSLFLFNSCSHIEFVPKPRPDQSPSGPEVPVVLLELLNKQETIGTTLDLTEITGTSLEQLIELPTPEGTLIRLRYQALGISLVEAIKLSRDQELLDRLFELVQWSDKPEVRAESLVTLAHFSDAKDLRYFQLALADENVGIQLAAVEALQKWALPEGMSMLKNTMRSPWSPLLQVIAAQAVLSLGDESGLPVLLELLDHRSWIIRAMATRYFGDYAGPDHLNKLLSLFNRENQNDFVVAELAIALLKVISKKDQDIVYSPLSKQWVPKEEISYILGKDNVIEMEPLVMIPPRLYISEDVRITQLINNKLLTIIQNRLDQELDRVQKSDPNLQTLDSFLTPMGMALQTRYRNLSLLVVQGLAGTKDPLLKTEIRNLAQENINNLVRASALVALGYSQQEEDIILIQNGLASSDHIIRFGAMEAVLAGKFKDLASSVINIAYTDPIPAYRVFAMRILMNFSNPIGRDLLLADLGDADWPARAMRFWYLGRFGEDDDFRYMIEYLARENNPFVRSELALGASRLAPLE